MGSHSLSWLNDRIIEWLVAEKEPVGMPLCNFERLRGVIQPGDVLLVEGLSRVSEVIKLITQSPWSHAAVSIGSLHQIKDPEIRARVALYHDGDPKEPLIIEALMDRGVVVTRLSEYKNHHVRICRPKGLSPWDTQKVIDFAVRHLGCDYDFRQIMDLARFLLPYGILPRRLGSSLFQHHAGVNTRAVCSSMLARAFMSVRFPIIPVAQRDQGDTCASTIEIFACSPRGISTSPPISKSSNIRCWAMRTWPITAICPGAGGVGLQYRRGLLFPLHHRDRCRGRLPVPDRHPPVLATLAAVHPSTLCRTGTHSGLPGGQHAEWSGRHGRAPIGATLPAVDQRRRPLFPDS